MAARAASFAGRVARDLVVIGCAVLAVMGILVACLDVLAPPSRAIHTLSDGRRKVTFVEMQHVADQAFYDRVRDRVRHEGSRGATLLFEGVEGSAEDIDRFSGIHGEGTQGGGLTGFLKTVADLAGLKFQPSFEGLTGRPDAWADLDVSTMLRDDPSAGAAGTADSWVRNRMLALGAWCREAGLTAPGHPARPAVRLLLRSLFTLSDLGMRLGLSPAPGLERSSRLRERRLVEVMEATPGDLVITYGAAHYPGFRKLIGPSWREVATEDNPVFL